MIDRYIAKCHEMIAERPMEAVERARRIEYSRIEEKQRDLNKKNNTDYDIPVFYLSELLALAFGFKPEDIGLRFHRVKPNALFESTGFIKEG